MQPAPGQGILLASQQYAPVLCILLIVPFVVCILRALVASSRHKSVCRRDRRRPLNPSPITSPPTCNLLLLYYSTSTVVPSRWVPGAARRAEGGDWLRPPRPTSRSSPAAGGPRRRPPAGGGGGRCGTPSCRLGSYRMCDRDRRRSGCGGGLCYSNGVYILATSAVEGRGTLAQGTTDGNICKKYMGL